jgi:hypothetical protein
MSDLRKKALGLSQEDLDEIVHDLKASEAAAINNEGRDSQIEYILSAGGEDILEQALKPEAEDPELD